MKTKAKHIASSCISTFLTMFWLYVSLDKLWAPARFRAALLRQPFPDWWADVLYWSLPLAELGIAMLFVLQRRRPAFLLSALLLLIFTIYIGLGVAGLYVQRPCGCASVFSGLSWTWHLAVNLGLLGLSIVGRYTTGPPISMSGRGRPRAAIGFRRHVPLRAVAVYHAIIILRKRFPKKFAPFPGRPVRVNLNYTFVALP
ncbi:MAG TPA: MauE/DoxX family redox-associated membrane protein [Sphingobacterium sp.]|nr:MauE/DoxX family redox-associated membrane protein [Sphingobacterium sp.]